LPQTLAPAASAGVNTDKEDAGIFFRALIQKSVLIRVDIVPAGYLWLLLTQETISYGVYAK
jgi:hypothetical protein